MSGCSFILRPIATAILMVVVFFALFGFLLTYNLRDNFLSAKFYNDNLAENDVYNRFYDEVLVDPEFNDTTDELLGNIDIPQEDIVGVAREIMPADYLQYQVEGAVTGAIDYLNKETDTPEVFIELAPPLAKVKPAIFSYMDRRIDELEEVPVSTLEDLETRLEDIYSTLETGRIPTQVPFIEDPDALVVDYVDRVIAEMEEVPANTPQDFEKEIGSIYRSLADGELPTRIPSIESLSPSQRVATYDLALQEIRRDPNIPDAVKAGLDDREEEIKDHLRGADVKGALAVASGSLTTASAREFIDDAYDNALESMKDAGLSEDALRGLEQQGDVIKGLLVEGKVKESLKVGAREIVGPLVDEALDELRGELDDRERLDLIAIAAEDSDQDKEQFLEELDAFREVIDRGGVVVWISIVVLVLGILLMMAVHIPHLASSLRWPGITLLLSGLAILIISLVSNSRLEGQFNALLDQGNATDSPIPPSIVNIANDVLTSMASDFVVGFILPSIIVMAIGVALLITSFFIRSLRVPFLSR